MTDSPQPSIAVNVGKDVVGTVNVAGRDIIYQYANRPDAAGPRSSNPTGFFRH